MGDLENYITVENLMKAKEHLVPHVLSLNYFNILVSRLKGRKLSENQRYYYNHYIKKKILGMVELFELRDEIKGIEFMKRDRLKKAINILKKYSRKHKGMKILISGSFLYGNTYNDIDIFIISKYDKEDYRDGNIHVNYLPDDIETTLFFRSIAAISISNFKPDTAKIDEEISIRDILHLYEVVILLMMQKDQYLPELRDLILNAEYMTNKVILNSLQLKIITDKIIMNKNPMKVINKYVITKAINTTDVFSLKKVLKRFIQKNSKPEKGRKIYENWKIYNKTYEEVLEIVA